MTSYLDEEHEDNEIIVLDSNFGKSLKIVIELFALMHKLDGILLFLFFSGDFLLQLSNLSFRIENVILIDNH